MPITETLAQEFQIARFSTKSKGFGEDQQIGSESLNVGQKIDAQGNVVREGLPLTGVLNEVTKGKTQREAFNALFNHPVYMKFEQDPAFSQDPNVVALSREERTARPDPNG